MRAVQTAQPRVTSGSFNAADVSDLPFRVELAKLALLRREMVGRLQELSNSRFSRRYRHAHPCLRREQRGARRIERRQQKLQRETGCCCRWSRIPHASGSGHRRHTRGATVKKRWLLPLPTRSRMKMSQPKFTRTGGPFTLVPLPDRDGAPCICQSCGWTMDRRVSQARMNAWRFRSFRGGDLTARSCHHALAL